MEIEKKYIVYKHICKINNKIYVGITCQRPENRWANGKSYNKNEDFYSDILEFGWNEGFDHKILIHGLTLEQAWSWEKKLIKTWDLMNPEKGYNKDSGGNSGKIPSEETRKKQSKIRKEKIANGEIIFSNAGKPLSEVAKNKIRQACTNKIYETSKMVLCIEKNIIYKSINEAVKKTGLYRPNIVKCCNGKRKTTGGYHWKFIN